MKIGRISLIDPAIPAAKQEAVAREVERAITSIFVEPSQFVTADIPTGRREEELRAALIRFCDQEKCHLVLTTGGTGPGPNDFAPDVTLEIVERHLPGLGELMRHSSFEHYKVAVLSRAEGGVRGRSLIINLPSRPAPVKFCLRVLQEGIVEAIEQLNGIKVNLRGDEIVIPLEKYLPFLKHIRPKADPGRRKTPNDALRPRRPNCARKRNRQMNPIKKQAHLAGLLYFIIAATGWIGLVYAPSVIYVRGDATATADHIRASEGLLRVGMASELFHQIVNVYLVLVLYRLFENIDKGLARQVVIFGALLSVPIVFLNVVNEAACLQLVSGSSYLSVFDKQQLDVLAMMFFRLHGQGLNVAAIFWGIWLIPFGLLVIRSGFIPRIFGYLLLIAGAAYVVDSFITVLAPFYEGPVDTVTGILEMGELPIIFWLLIWGARVPTEKSPA